MNKKHIWIITRYEFTRSISNGRGILFLSFYALFWFWLLWKLSAGGAAWIGSADGSMLTRWVIGQQLVSLVESYPPTLVVYYWLALIFVPFFVMWGACDQIATDLGSKHIRFLIPRCGRFEIYMGRFLGTLFFIILAEMIIGIVAALISFNVDGQDVSVVLFYMLRVNISIALYSIPFVALMSLLSAMTASATISALVGINGYLIWQMVISVMALNWDNAKTGNMLFPSVLRESLTVIDVSEMMTNHAFLMIYIGLYFGLGWLMFRSRDV